MVNVEDVLDPSPTFTESEYTMEVAEGTYTNVCTKHSTVDMLHFQLVPL